MEGFFEDPQICRRAVSDRTSHEAHTNRDRTDCQTHRLGINLPTDKLVEVSVPLLLQSYREKYPADPVTEQEFGKLVGELRPNVIGTEQRNKTNTNTAHAELQGYPVTKQVSPANNNDDHETMNERDGNSEPHPTNIFTEFVNGWRNLRPNGATAKRKLDVLSWGFGE
jgi:hypothetical protein